MACMKKCREDVSGIDKSHRVAHLVSSDGKYQGTWWAIAILVVSFDVIDGFAGSLLIGVKSWPYNMV